MSGIINKSKSVDSTNNAFSPVPNKDSFPWKRVENNKDVPIPPPSNEEKASLPRIDKKKETLYSAYDSFLDDKRNTYLSESTLLLILLIEPLTMMIPNTNQLLKIKWLSSLTNNQNHNAILCSPL